MAASPSWGKGDDQMTSTVEQTLRADPISGAYWDGAFSGRLVLQQCQKCLRVRHYPQPMCPGCHSFDTGWIEASGAGTIYSWTITHHPFDESLANEVPYALVTVELVEGVRVLARSGNVDGMRMNQPVIVRFSRVDEEHQPMLTVERSP